MAPVAKSELSASIWKGFIESREMSTGAGVLGKVLNKPAVEVSEPKERLYFFLIGWGRPFCYTRNFDQVHGDRVVGYDHSKVLNHGFFELTLVRPEIKFVFLQELQDL